MPVKTKRWNDPVEPDDGYRLLVTRHRPRGVARADETWATWCPHVAPSRDLVARFWAKHGETPISWEDYRARYLAEMERQTFWIRGLAADVARGETITLLCSSSCTDEARCHRSLLRDLVLAAAFPKRDSREAAPRPTVHRRARP